MYSSGFDFWYSFVIWLTLDEIDQIGEYHETFLPAISNLLNSGDSVMHYHAIAALDAIVESLEEKILPYLPSLMGRLISFLETGERKLKVIVTACIGSAAHAAGNAFSPYFAEVMVRLSHLMTLGQDKDDLDLRGVATDTAGTVAEAVGKDLFRVCTLCLINSLMWKI
jgi:hypothetical protein